MLSSVVSSSTKWFTCGVVEALPLTMSVGLVFFLDIHIHNDQSQMLSSPRTPKDPKTSPSSSEYPYVKAKESCMQRTEVRETGVGYHGSSSNP